jgi:hypothetical protein
MFSDLRFAFRSIRRTPVFTAIVIIALAVGIAGATAIASLTPQDSMGFLAAAFGPARRASRVNPIETLRYE